MTCWPFSKSFDIVKTGNFDKSCCKKIWSPAGLRYLGSAVALLHLSSHWLPGDREFRALLPNWYFVLSLNLTWTSNLLSLSRPQHLCIAYGTCKFAPYSYHRYLSDVFILAALWLASEIFMSLFPRTIDWLHMDSMQPHSLNWSNDLFPPHDKYSKRS